VRNKSLLFQRMKIEKEIRCDDVNSAIDGQWGNGEKRGKFTMFCCVDTNAVRPGRDCVPRPSFFVNDVILLLFSI
jgi:hypothetical protein